jgi:hypothetical protein
MTYRCTVDGTYLTNQLFKKFTDSANISNLLRTVLTWNLNTAEHKKYEYAQTYLSLKSFAYFIFNMNYKYTHPKNLMAS